MKRTEKKSRSMPLRGKLVCYFLVFAAVLLSILWVFQTVLLDDIYRFIKESQLQRVATSLANHIDDDNIEALTLEAREKSDMNVGIYKIESRRILELYTSKDKGDISLTFMPHEVYGFYELAKEQGGSATCSISELESDIVEKHYEDIDLPAEREKNEALVTAKLVESEDAQYMVLAKARISPVTSTVETLRIMLVVITVVFIVFAIIMAIYAAAKISKPIVKTNEAAKELARQNYSVSFEGKGSKEVEELSDTLNFAARELSTVDTLRKELISNISHDLRTPLTMIGGYAEVMRDIPGENTPENLQIIIDESEHLSALVTDLLSLSRLESGTSELTKSEFSLTESVRSIFSRYTKFIRDKELSITFEADRDVWVYADELKLSQVIYNLINNAINYSKSPKTVLVRQSVTDSKVKLEIIDNGKGIPKEELPEIWDRYYRAKEEHKSAVIGTGLGLSIVKNILRLHDARFGVISQKDIGSNFWFEIDRLTDKIE